MAMSESENPAVGYAPTAVTLGMRVLAWGVVVTLGVFILNTYLTFWLGWPGAGAAFGGGGFVLGWVQVLFYGAAVAAAAAVVARTRMRSLRADGAALAAVAAYLVRVSFWAVLFVGMADAVISFLRVEGFLEGLVGAELALDLGRNKFRAPVVHLPLIVVSLVIAARHRGLGFPWLTLMVVVAELLIVMTRFIFSYEQAFMADLVRFWYGGLFLFASAYTLIEEGHVRVDVLYAGFTDRNKGLVNAIGAVVLGLPLCWVVLVIGLGQPTSIIASPLLALEVTQAGFGMYVKYLLAAFLGIFAASMMIQFAGCMLEAVADIRGDPGKRKLKTEIAD